MPADPAAAASSCCGSMLACRPMPAQARAAQSARKPAAAHLQRKLEALVAQVLLHRLCTRSRAGAGSVQGIAAKPHVQSCIQTWSRVRHVRAVQRGRQTPRKQANGYSSQRPPTRVAVDVLQHLHEVGLTQERTRLQGRRCNRSTRHSMQPRAAAGMQQHLRNTSWAAKPRCMHACQGGSGGSSRQLQQGSPPARTCGLVVRRASTSG